MSPQQSARRPSSRSNVQYPEKGAQPAPTVSGRESLPRPPALPLPSTSETFRPPLANPPPHLDPPFTPNSPKLRPHFSDVSVRSNGLNQASHRMGNRSWPASIAPISVTAPPIRGTSLPPIYPRAVSRPASIPGTNYEPISPLESIPHEVPGRSSLFDDSTYNVTPYHGSVGPQAQQSPTNSYHSSMTSSSGQQSSAILNTQKTGPPTIAKSTSKAVEEQDMYNS